MAVVVQIVVFGLLCHVALWLLVIPTFWRKMLSLSTMQMETTSSSESLVYTDKKQAQKLLSLSNSPCPYITNMISKIM